MKKFLSLLIAAAIIGFAVFAIMFWGTGMTMAESRILAITVGVTGFIVEYLRPFIAKWSKQLDIASNRKTVSRKKV